MGGGGGEDANFKGASKHFNTVTPSGRLNTVLGTLGAAAAFGVYMGIKSNRKKSALADKPVFPEGSKCLAKKHLTNDVWIKLKDTSTSSGTTLVNLIQSGLDHEKSNVGVYMGDAESYTTFAPFVNKVIEDYHKPFKVTQKHTSNFNPASLKADNPDPSGKYINSTRVRVARNLAGYPLPAKVSDDERAEIEKNVLDVLNGLGGEFAGHYYSVPKMTEAERRKWIGKGMLFETEVDHYLESVGITRDWPNNRGMFVADNEKFLCWINEEDELRIISMEKGGDIKAVFKRLSTIVNTLESKLGFLKDAHLGNLASCPTNIGTGMRASVHINLPNVYKKADEMKKITEKYHIQARGKGGELSKPGEGGIYDISNLRRLGLSEVQCVQDMYDGVKALIALEEQCKKL